MIGELGLAGVVVIVNGLELVTGQAGAGAENEARPPATGVNAYGGS